MALPYVKINFANGAISSVLPQADKVAGMIVSAVASGDFALGTAYCIHHLSEAVEMGLSKTANPFAYEQIRQFYAEAGEGAELWVYGVAKSVKPSAMLDKTGNHAPDLIQSANGRIRYIAACWDDSDATLTPSSGLDSDVITAVGKGQELAEWATNTLFAPLFVLVYGYGYSHSTVATMPDLTQRTDNRVAVFVGAVEDEDNIALGLLAGKVAACEVQTHIGRVKDGAVKATKAFIGAKDAAVGASETLNTKGYITFRTFVGKAGYFFSDDHMATAVTDDYHSVCNRRVIDKAYRVAYSALLEKVNDEIPVTDEGTMPTSIVHALQGSVETAVINNMTAYGNLGTDPEDSNDTGVECYIDPSQKVVTTSTLNVNLKVKPYGYAKYIECTLGFMTM